MTYRPLVLALALCAALAAPAPAQTDAPCTTETDEFTQATTIDCPNANATVQQQPGNALYTTQINLVKAEGRPFVLLTTSSDSWNFLDVDRAYMIADGQNFNSKLMRVESEVQGGSVIEQNVTPLTEDALRALAQAKSFRIKVGQAVFRVTGHRSHAEYLLSK
jgi:hypothetical protein